MTHHVQDLPPLLGLKTMQWERSSKPSACGESSEFMSCYARKKTKKNMREYAEQNLLVKLLLSPV